MAGRQSHAPRPRGVRGLKKSAYFEEDMIDALLAEAERLERSVSWVVQWCVRRHLRDLRSLPNAEPLPEEDAREGEARV